MHRWWKNKIVSFWLTRIVLHLELKIMILQLRKSDSRISKQFRTALFAAGNLICHWRPTRKVVFNCFAQKIVYRAGHRCRLCSCCLSCVSQRDYKPSRVLNEMRLMCISVRRSTHYWLLSTVVVADLTLMDGNCEYGVCVCVCVFFHRYVKRQKL